MKKEYLKKGVRYQQKAIQRLLKINKKVLTLSEEIEHSLEEKYASEEINNL